ncbi:TonB-dependent receptor [Pseudoalteromonas sp. McH1-7]|uniref:TonB-dependent receptor n=1 Tax=Pseudoalteromonas sp. McH1-7 TaxID=2745574 RepID=UPI00159181F3|nr:TonB-dependent receptor [Pseudoalteromonas sp. McH1-7]NUZ12419.1 TonB-dependent receptor [Pseudoalteromonas sp. McH1-7]
MKPLGKIPFAKSTICLSMLAASSSFYATAETQSDDGANEQIEKITVTSRRKEETIIEIPMQVSTISSMDIADRNLVSAEDFYRTLAGAASPRGQLILRGLSGGNTAFPDTTSVFVDDVPFTFENLNDVERVEVLRGPQGTLYGSNAIGGTVRIITKKPVLDEFEFFASTQIGSEKDVDGLHRNISMGVNIPLVDDTLALRVSGNTEHERYQMVNMNTGVQGNADRGFIRGQLLWQVDPETSVTLGYAHTTFSDTGTTTGDRSTPGYYWDYSLTANEEADYGYDVDFFKVSCPETAERPQCNAGSAPIANKGVPQKYQIWDLMDPWSDATNDLFTINIQDDNIFDIASLTYAGSHRTYEEDSIQTSWSRLDASDMFRTWIIDHRKYERVTHQLRFQNIDINSPLSWTIGAYYDEVEYGFDPNYQNQYHEKGDKVSALALNWWGADATQIGIDTFGNPQNNWNLTNIRDYTEELAFFADVAYEFDLGDSGSLEVNGGVRRFELKDGSHYTQEGIWATSEDNLSGEESGNRYKFSVSYRPTEEMSVYGLYSEGYRPGGNNGPLAASCEADPLAKNRKDRYTSDAIENYELGFKASVLDRKVDFSAAVYRIDWTDIKTSVYMDTCGFSYTANGGEAKSEGFEFESTARLTDDLTMSFNTSYTSSEITQDNESISASAGDKMTMVPEWNAYLALDQNIQLFGKDAYIRGEYSFYDEYKTHFNVRDEDKTPAYSVFNVSGRIQLSDSLKLSVFVNNLFDKETATYMRARSRNANNSAAQEYINYLNGRTISLRVDYTFF